MKVNKILKETSNSRVYMMAQRQHNGCPFCKKSRGCNYVRIGWKNKRNWKHYRKTQYKPVEIEPHADI